MLSDMQKKIVACYDGDLTKAVVMGGSKCKNPRNYGCYLMRKVPEFFEAIKAKQSNLLQKIDKAVEERQDEIIRREIWGVTDIQEFWTKKLKNHEDVNILNDPKGAGVLAKMASDLTKSHGGFLEKREEKQDITITIKTDLFK